jgi:hypothetical protein
MEHAIEMDSDDTIYISSFIKNGSVIHKLIGWIHRQHGNSISLLLASK